MFYPIPSRGKYKLARDWAYQRGGYVPAGFMFDGASIPWVAQWLTYSPFHPRVMRAACAHDWLYSTHIHSRKHADDIFHRLLRREGCKAWKAHIMWLAVRLFGMGAWKRESGDGLR